MKYVLSFFLAAFLSLSAIPSYSADAQKQKICIDEIGKDGKPVKNKDGTNKQKCKEMKIHEKLEGTKVPEKK